MALLRSKTLMAGALMALASAIIPAAVAQADDTTHDSNADLRQPLSPQNLPSPQQIKKDRWIAYRMAHSYWLDKAAAANPRILAAICAHPGPAKALAQHRHLAELADADHYLCRRLARWPQSLQKMIRNPDCEHVIQLDPEGIYNAIDGNPQVARLLARDPMFQDMIDANPALGKVMTQHMH
jgi:hypothetical protein